ncbi:MAG: peptidylprolyl isomerase [Janthinobacterium lividum]
MRLPSLLCLWAWLPMLAAAAPPAHPYADATRRRIATAQDERNTAALLPFLVDKNVVYRAAAALAFGSVQDTTAVPALLPLLADKSVTVRRAAAFALGETGNKTATEALGQRLAKATDYQEKKALGEALGRCVPRASVPLLWQSLPAAPDTASRTALAWGLYRAALRGLATPELVRQAAATLGQAKAPLAARRGASAALVRARGAGVDSALAQVALPVLLKAMAADPDYFVQANCASTLGRLRRRGVLPALLAATNQADFRVRIAALRALPARPYAVSTAAVEPALRRELPQEALAAAEWLLRTRPDSLAPASDLLALARRTPHFRARTTVLQAALRYAAPPERLAVADTIRQRLARTTSPYEKAALLTALSEDPAQFDFLAQQAQQLAPPLVVPGTALGALVALRGKKEFPAVRQADFTAVLRRALASGDVTQLGIAAEALANSALVPAPGPDDLAALRQAQARLTLPRDVEAWLGIQQALDKITKAPSPTAPPATPRQPIDWAAVQRVPVGQRVRFITTKGLVIMVLKVEEAPGSVATFAQLVQRHFYDGLYFHRVVADFVAQGGDPRGDGSGSLPATLRSEFSYLTYGTGAVGLASAGKDTESCQFFFTHLPTPHLDGRYTIFAQVVEGQAVVQRLEVGDQMLRVELL